MDNPTSPAQDDWKAIAEKLRLELAKRIADIPAMTPPELVNLVEALKEAEALEQWCAVHDDWINSRRRELETPHWLRDE